MGFLNIWLTSFFNLDKYSLSITFLIVGGKSAENKGDPNFWQTNHPAAHGKVLAWWGNRKTKSKLCEIPHTCQSGHPQKDKKQVPVRMWRKGNLHALSVGTRVGAATMETVWWVLKKLKLELPRDSAVLGIDPKELMQGIEEILVYLYLWKHLFTIARKWK